MSWQLGRIEQDFQEFLLRHWGVVDHVVDTERVRRDLVSVYSDAYVLD